LPGNAPGASGAPGARPEQRARAALQAARELAELANVALAEAEHAARAEDDDDMRLVRDEQDDLAGQLLEFELAAPMAAPKAPAQPAPAPVPTATPTGLEIPGRVMPSVFSSESFYANVVNEVELLGQQPQLVVGQPMPATLDVLPTAVLARVVGLAADADLFVLCEVSHGFQLAVHEHVDSVYAAEERARKGSWGPLRIDQSIFLYPLENVRVNLCTSYRTHFNSTMNHYMVEAMVEGGGLLCKRAQHQSPS
jgi:hypothetical protein